jgi:hypothetical protein
MEQIQNIENMKCHIVLNGWPGSTAGECPARGPQVVIFDGATLARVSIDLRPAHRPLIVIFDRATLAGVSICQCSAHRPLIIIFDRAALTGVLSMRRYEC